VVTEKTETEAPAPKGSSDPRPVRPASRPWVFADVGLLKNTI
jgi:hypothetical protein